MRIVVQEATERNRKEQNMI